MPARRRDGDPEPPFVNDNEQVAESQPDVAADGVVDAAAGDTADAVTSAADAAADDASSGSASDAAGDTDGVPENGSGTADHAGVAADTSGETAQGVAPDGGPARRPRREKPRRDPNAPLYGELFLDALQRTAGLRGQFAYGVPARLWRANREVMIRILREEVPMPTFKNQIQCILHEDPELLAQDVHYEMLTSAVPPEDSFRWLWLFMMLR